MHSTLNDLPEKKRKILVHILNENLANSLSLTLQAKQAHWNVKGMRFKPLHELFDTIYEETSEWNDLLAERAVQLGGTAYGTLETVIKTTKLSPYPTDITSGKEHVKYLSQAVASFGKSIRKSISKADENEDAGTADLFTEIVRASDKILWMLEAHLSANTISSKV